MATSSWAGHRRTRILRTSSEAQLRMMSRKQTALRLLLNLRLHMAPCNTSAAQKAMSRLPRRAKHRAGGAGYQCMLLHGSCPPSRPRQNRHQASTEGLEGEKVGPQWPP